MNLSYEETKWPEVDESINGMQRYQIYRPFLKNGDVLEWRNEEILGLGYPIRFFTGAKVNHTGGVFRFGCLSDEMNDRVYTLEAMAKGFYPTYLRQSLEGYKGKVYALILKPCYEGWRIKIASEQWKMIGVGYDFLSLFGNIFGKVGEGARRYFCSEAIGMSFRSLGLISESYNDGKALRPGDFMKTKIFEREIRIY